MNWSADDLRQLRYRLGWSRAEMARRLNLELSTVMDWEAGKLPSEAIEGQHRSALLHIFQQAEKNADRVHRRPIAEVIMRDRGLSQIHDFDVIDSMDEKAALKGNS